MATMAESPQSCIEKLGLLGSALRADAAEFVPAPFTPTYSKGSVVSVSVSTSVSTAPPSPAGSAATATSPAGQSALILSEAIPPREGCASCRGPLAWPPAAAAAPPSMAALTGHLGRCDAVPGPIAGLQRQTTAPDDDAPLTGAPPPGLDVPADLPPGLHVRGCTSRFEPWFVSLPEGTRKRQLPAGEPVKKQPPMW
jgi:hypothetical protein